MQKSAKETDFSAVITQVAKDDDQHRSLPTTVNSSATVNRPKSKKPKRRIVNFLLCCLGGNCRRRSNNADYLADGEPTVDHERLVLNPEFNLNLESNEKFLLPAQRQNERSKICLVIDLDETLVHSSFKPVANADFVVPVEIDGQVHQVYVTKRPHVDEFLLKVGQMYECVLFTASLAKYADPVADLLDPSNVFRSRLFRESCTFFNGNYVKDLSRLGRDLRKVIIIDNSPASYIFHQENAVPVSSWFDDMHDTELLTLLPIFERLALNDDVIQALHEIHRGRSIV